MHGATIKKIIFLCLKLAFKFKMIMMMIMMIMTTTVIMTIIIRLTYIFTNLGLGPLLRNAR